MSAPTCPRCGARMNHEADKLVYPTTREEEAAVNAAFDGMIEEIFACPGCGRIESRRADDDGERR